MIHLTSRFGLRGLLLLLIAWSTCRPPLQAQEPQAPPLVTLPEVVQAWRGRQERLQNVYVEWNETRTDFVGANLWVDPIDRSNTEHWWPDEDTTFESRHNLTLSGVRSRIETDGLLWSGPDFPFKLGPRIYTSVFDGTDAKWFDAYAGEDRYPDGSFGRFQQNMELSASHVWVLTSHARPFDPKMGGIDETTLAMLPEQGLVEGRFCIVLEARPSSERVIPRWKFWVDPQQGLNVVRAYLLGEGSKVESMYEVSHVQDDGRAWRPDSWKYVLLSNGKPATQMLGQVTLFDPAPTITDATFELEFPAGTWVVDQRGEKEESWIVKDDESKRPILMTEILSGATYEQLRGTESGAARGTRPPIQRHWWTSNWTWIAAAVLALGAATWWRTTRRRTAG